MKGQTDRRDSEREMCLQDASYYSTQRQIGSVNNVVSKKCRTLRSMEQKKLTEPPMARDVCDRTVYIYITVQFQAST